MTRRIAQFPERSGIDVPLAATSRVSPAEAAADVKIRDGQADNLRIEGYTDSAGSDELNQRLSRERAESVRSFLEKQGVAAGRMTAVGYGPKFPVADNATPEGRAKNRRVEIVLAEGVVPGAGN